MLNPGDQIAAYTVVKLLGKGGIGEVYLARHRVLERVAAIKVLRADLSAEPELALRLLAEARAASAIDHPAITHVLDCDVLPDGRVFLVTEFLRGIGLRSAMAIGLETTRDLTQVMALLAAIADGLRAAHALQIVHRDVKPENLFLSLPRRDAPHFQPKVLDFGIAKSLADQHPLRLTRTGAVVGTPLYMAPEQCMTGHPIDARVDIYALGCLAFELLVGRPPFNEPSIPAMLLAHADKPAPRLQQMAPHLPGGLSHLINRMLEKAPLARPGTMGEICTTLSEWLDSEPSQLSRLLPVPSAFPRVIPDVDAASAPILVPSGVAEPFLRSAPQDSATKGHSESQPVGAQPAAHHHQGSGPPPLPQALVHGRPFIHGASLATPQNTVPPAHASGAPTQSAVPFTQLSVLSERHALTPAPESDRASDTTLGRSATERPRPASESARTSDHTWQNVGRGSIALALVLGAVWWLRPTPSAPRQSTPTQEPARATGKQPVLPAAHIDPPQVERSEPISERGLLTLEVLSQPSGAEVWLEGETSPRGRTPLLLTDLTPTPTDLALRLHGFETARRSITPGQERQLSIALRPAVEPEGTSQRPASATPSETLQHSVSAAQDPDHSGESGPAPRDAELEPGRPSSAKHQPTGSVKTPTPHKSPSARRDDDDDFDVVPDLVYERVED